MSHKRGAVALVAAVMAVMLTAVPTAYAEMIAGTFAWNPPPYAPGTHYQTSFGDVVTGPAGSVYVVGAYNGMAYAASGIVARVNGTTGAKMWALTTKGFLWRRLLVRGGQGWRRERRRRRDRIAEPPGLGQVQPVRCAQVVAVARCP